MRIFQRNHLLDFENFLKLFNFGRKQLHQMRPAVGSRVGHAAISFDRRVERCVKTSDFSAERLCRRRRVSSLGTLRLRSLAAGRTGRRIAPSLVPSGCRVSVGPTLPATPASSGGKTPVRDNLARPADREMCADRGFPARRLCRRRQSLFPRNLAVKAACSRGDQATHRTESGPVRMPSQRRPCFTPAGGKTLVRDNIARPANREMCADRGFPVRTTLQTTAEPLPSCRWWPASSFSEDTFGYWGLPPRRGSRPSRDRNLHFSREPSEQ